MFFVFQEDDVKRNTNRIFDVVNQLRLGHPRIVVQFLVWVREFSLFRSVKNKIWDSHKFLSISYFGDHFLGDNATGRKTDHASHLLQSFKMSGEILPLPRIPLYCARFRIYHLQKDNKEQAVQGLSSDRCVQFHVLNLFIWLFIMTLRRE